MDFRIDTGLFEASSPVRWGRCRAVFGCAVAVCILGAFGSLDCAMSDTGTIDFVGNPATKGKPKKPPMACAYDGDCAPPNPYCDSVTATCIQCLADPNCTGPKRFCGPRGACVECVSEAGCEKAKPYCDVERLTCVECQLDAHCGATKVCDTISHRCVPICAASGDCEPMLPYCDPARRLCVECIADANCTDSKKPACSAASGACVECTAPAQCPLERPQCDPLTSKCVE